MDVLGRGLRRRNRTGADKAALVASGILVGIAAGDYVRIDPRERLTTKEWDGAPDPTPPVQFAPHSSPIAGSRPPGDETRLLVHLQTKIHQSPCLQLPLRVPRHARRHVSAGLDPLALPSSRRPPLPTPDGQRSPSRREGRLDRWTPKCARPLPLPVEIARWVPRCQHSPNGRHERRGPAPATVLPDVVRTRARTSDPDRSQSIGRGRERQHSDERQSRAETPGACAPPGSSPEFPLAHVVELLSSYSSLCDLGSIGREPRLLPTASATRWRCVSGIPAATAGPRPCPAPTRPGSPRITRISASPTGRTWAAAHRTDRTL